MAAGTCLLHSNGDGHHAPATLEMLENDFTIANSFWFAIGTLMQQGSDLNPKVADVVRITTPLSRLDIDMRQLCLVLSGSVPANSTNLALARGLVQTDAPGVKLQMSGSTEMSSLSKWGWNTAGRLLVI